MGADRLPEPGGGRPQRDEHRAEAGDEAERGQQHPPTHRVAEFAPCGPNSSMETPPI